MICSTFTILFTFTILHSAAAFLERFKSGANRSDSVVRISCRKIINALDTLLGTIDFASLGAETGYKI